MYQSWGSDTSRDSRRGELAGSLLLLTFGSGLSASSNGQLSDPANTRNLAARQIFVKVPQILLEFLKRFTLSQIVREVLKIAEPHALVMPMDVSSNAHGFSVPCGGLGRRKPGG